MKTILYIIITLSLLTSLYFMHESKSKNNKVLLNPNQYITEKKANSKNSNTMKSPKKVNGLALGSINPLYEELRPPSNDDLEDLWEEEYGCYKSTNVGNDKCSYAFLNAKSLKEAMWMKRNGYPTKYMMNLSKQDENKQLFEELVNANFPEALTVAAVLALENNDKLAAFKLSYAAQLHGGFEKSFPHILYGESKIANNQQNLAIDEFMIAALLGDNQAQIKGIALAPDKYALAFSLKSAYASLLRHFGENFPVDERPINTTENVYTGT